MWRPDTLSRTACHPQAPLRCTQRLLPRGPTWDSFWCFHLAALGGLIWTHIVPVQMWHPAWGRHGTCPNVVPPLPSLFLLLLPLSTSNSTLGSQGDCSKSLYGAHIVPAQMWGPNAAARHAQRLLLTAERPRRSTKPRHSACPNRPRLAVPNGASEASGTFPPPPPARLQPVRGTASRRPDAQTCR